jgi:rfaE bifunctional protein kinase chain/domain/rfaE bifunctional protein nucleotidyltransferase chain/domain
VGPVTCLPDPLDRFADLRVLVLGDALLDGWLSGRPSRLCREAPVAVVDLEDRRYACGGAANTAVNLAALGGRATLVAAVGADAAGDRLRVRLAAAGVTAQLATVRPRRTLVKSRVLADGQVLARLDDGDAGPIPGYAAARLIDLAATELDRAGEGYQAIVVCDYGAGTLTDPVRAWLGTVRQWLPLFVLDAHELSGWARLRPDVVTPNFVEAAALLPGPVTGNRAAWVTRHATQLVRRSGARTVAVTLDADGAVLVERDTPPVRVHPRAASVRSTTGAGDCYVAAFTLALAAGLAGPAAAELAQRAAEIAVSGSGTAVCTAADLAASTMSSIVDDVALARLVAGYREQGRRIVFTNGCFDVLHRGHVGYLEEAARLGDVLVVAVNSDDSVRRLKGADRPVNPAPDRVAILAALRSVAHVVVFDEDSPRKLIALVRPDVYVKGGDYPPELIPEAPLVRQLGGEVRTMAYLPDRSTSQLIDRIRAH